MELDEIRKRAFLREYMEGRERELAAPKHPCEGMSQEEIFSFVTFLQKRLEEESARNEDIKNRLDNVFDQLVKSQKTNESNAKALARLIEVSESQREQLMLLAKERDRLLKENESLKSQNEINKRHRFGSRSQKGVAKKQSPLKDRDEDKDDFDGTSGCAPVSAGESGQDTPETTVEKESRDYRKGMTYNTMNAQSKRIHRCDERMLPEGCVIIKREFKKVFDRVSYIVEHDYEYITYRMPDGSIRTEYFPVSKDEERVQFVPGTHATPDLLACLAFNNYCIFTPLYREMSRFANESMQISRQTLTNWLGKGARYLERLFPALKEKALAEGSVDNVDETWCRLHLVGKSGKKYIWCLVNKLAKTVIFFYDNGSRGREVLKDFLGDARIAALQSDGYNIYNYLDDKLLGIEHICCLAHARAKFKYAQEQGGDDRATAMLELIAELYQLEKEYKEARLDADEIRKRRNDAKKTDVLTALSTMLHELKMVPETLGDQMRKAVNYLDTYWNQIFNYRNDGRYSIDNSIAERCIRPLTRERANSLHYASHKGAEVSAIYHTFISTCKMVGVSALDYMKKVFSELLTGSNDYAGLLPHAIALK